MTGMRTIAARLAPGIALFTVAMVQHAYAADENSERQFVLANVEFALLHEIAHVLIWELKLPVFGREEDAADNIAAIALMMTYEQTGAPMLDSLQAVADGWKLEWQLVADDEIEHAYWDLHTLEIQRYYNIACLVYGADPANRTQILEVAGLPAERAEFCQEEYNTAQQAMQWLFNQHSGTRKSTENSSRVHLVYDTNPTLDGKKLDGWLRRSQIPERLVQMLDTRFDLPRDITISFARCKDPNASWDSNTSTITFCYSLMNRFLFLAREVAKSRATSVDGGSWNGAAYTTGAAR